MNSGNRQLERKIAHAESHNLKITAARKRIAEAMLKLQGVTVESKSFLCDFKRMRVCGQFKFVNN